MKAGYTKSCGCYSRESASSRKKIDLTGKQFGRLTVLEFAKKTKRGRYMWRCLCSCGKEKLIVSSNLTRGNTQSCGCLHRELVSIPKFGMPSSQWRVLRYYKKHAKDKELPFDLTVEDFEKITKQECFYCGLPPSNLTKGVGIRPNFVYSGIDRVDNSRGYVLDNVVPCCVQCNKTKRNMTKEDFLGLVKRIYEHSIKRPY